MKYLLSFSLIALFLAGCLSVGEYGETSPYRQKALAEAEIQETTAARVEREAQATLQAARAAGQTEQEIARVMAPVRAKETEMALESTAAANRAAAATLSAAETAQSFANAAAALDHEKRRIEAQNEINRKFRQEQNAAAWDSVWRWAWPLLLLAVGGAFAALLYFLPRRWLEHRIRQQRQKDSVMLLTDGVNAVPVWLDENGEPHVIGSPISVSGNEKQNHNAPRAITGTWGNGDAVKTVGASGNVLVSRPAQPDRSTTGRTLAFVQQAIRKAGHHQDTIPGWRAMGITSSEWQRDFEPLKMAGLVEKGEKENDSYHLRLDGAYSSLYELEQALRSRALVLRPAPAPPYSVAGD